MSSPPKIARRAGLLFSAVVAFVLLSVGFLGLGFLIQERPQFVGQRLSPPQLVFEQPSPGLLLRNDSSDVNVVEPAHPTRAYVDVTLNTIPDHRGLKTMHSLNGRFEGRYEIENPEKEPIHFLMKCEHPRFARSGAVPLSSVKLSANPDTTITETAMAWFWTGEIAVGETAHLGLTYDMPGRLREFRYKMDRIGDGSIPYSRLTMQTTGHGEVHFKDSKGTAEPSTPQEIVWERHQFFPPETYTAEVAPTRSLHSALTHLVQIGPLLLALFLITLVSVLYARCDMTVLHVFTLSAAYAIYFPLIVYLSVKFEFKTALFVSIAVSGALLLNYGRLLLGARWGVLAGVLVLAIFQVFPTLTAFAGWNRGMVLLCLGVITLFVLIDLQNRSMKRVTTTAALTLLFLNASAWTSPAQEEAQTLPSAPSVYGPPWIAYSPPPTPEEKPSVSLDLAHYEMTLDDGYVDVRVRVPFAIHGDSRAFHVLFDDPVFAVERAVPAHALLTLREGALGLLPVAEGEGELTLRYRAPLTESGDRVDAQIPLCLAPAGTIELIARRDNLEFENAVLWQKTTLDESIRYDLGVAQATAFTIGWQEGDKITEPPSSPGRPTLEASSETYGIGIVSSDQLTVVNSDGTCLHFAWYELPAFHADSFEVTVPQEARILSASLDQFEIEEPILTDGRCRIPVETAQDAQPRRLLLRLSYPRVRLGFLGHLQFDLPEVTKTIGELSWTIVLPQGFQTQVTTSDLNPSPCSLPLDDFGSYQGILIERTTTPLSKSLAPPRRASAKLRYCQNVDPWTSDLLKHYRLAND